MYRVLARYYTGQEWSQWSEWYREGRLCTALAAERRKALLLKGVETRTATTEVKILVATEEEIKAEEAWAAARGL